LRIFIIKTYRVVALLNLCLQLSNFCCVVTNITELSNMRNERKFSGVATADE